MPNTYVALRTETVAVATNSVTFNLSGISGYTDLVVVASMPASGAVTTAIRFNSDTATNYSTTLLVGSAGGASSYRESNKSYGITGGLVSGLGANSNFILNIQNYANTSTFKTILVRSNSATNNEVAANVILYRSTSAITSINFIDYNGGSNNYPVGTTFSLYGIANADQGSAKATGGIITEDSQYWYHTFGASGAFIPKQSLTCDVLVVAGGGGGGNMYAGGGGAGGVAYQTGRSVSATTYNITVGAGATAVGSGATSNGNNGNNSTFDTITANGGGGGGSYTIGTGSTGGSGGGAAMPTSNGTIAGGAANQGTSGGATGYGNAGGASLRNGGIFLGGGGGGAGAAGSAASGSIAGAGGVGLTTWSSWGVVTGIGENVSGTYYLAGGGGGGAEGGTASSGGLGGGGRGGLWATYAPSNGTTNTGGGGGAVGGNLATGASGGSGVVIIRYLKN